MARTFAFIALLQPVLHRVYCHNKTFPNPPEQYEMLQNMSLGSHGVDRVLLLQKIPTRLRGTNFCTSSERFAPSFVWQPNGQKNTQMVRNTPKHEFGVIWGWIGCVRREKFQFDFVAQTFALVWPILPRVS